MGLIRSPRLLISLTIKQHRFEIGTHLAITAVLLITSAGVAMAFASLDLERCEAAGNACQAAEASWVSLRVPATILAYAMAALPVLTGVIVGASLVSSELERQTVFIPWTIGRSRRRWLLDRALVLGLVVVLPLLLLGATSDLLQQATFPTVPVGQSLADYELRGWLVPVRAAIGLTAGIAAGVVGGRAIPSLLLGLAVAGLAIGTTVVVGRSITLSGVTEVSDPGAIITDFKYRDKDGHLLTFEEALARVPIDDPAFGAQFELVDFGISGSRSPIVVGTEGSLGLIVCIGLLGASSWLIERRRPS